ncbi:energy transducer TonB family protein [Nostoc sp.]|uniref:energy transducer TonB family protein n=1 Tax=Nostoc sp. TaxID=1180 RepID=UPI002FF8835F
MTFSHEFQRYRSVRPGQMLQGLVISILLHSTLIIGRYWLTAFTPKPKEEIPIEVVEVYPNETHIPQKTSFRATKDSIAGGKALPKRPVSAVKSTNSDAHKASSKSPLDLTALSPAKVLQPEPRQQKAESLNLSPQQPKPQPTAMSTRGIATAPVIRSLALKPQPTASAPVIRSLAPKPQPTASAPVIRSLAPKPQPTAISTTGVAAAPVIRSLALKPQPTASAPAIRSLALKPQPTAIAPVIRSLAPKPQPTAISTTGLAGTPVIRSPALKPQPTASARAIRSLALKPQPTAIAPVIRSPALKPQPTAIAPVIRSPALKPKKIVVVPNITPLPALPRKTAMSTMGVAAAPATIPPVPNPKNLDQSGTRLNSGQTRSQAHSSQKTGGASLLGGTVGVSSRNFNGDYLAALPNSNRDRQAPSSIDASSQNIDITSYLNQLQQQVKQQWLPEVSQSSRRTVLNFTVNRSGQLRNLQLAQTSGFNLTDQAALKAIQRAAPFAPLPTGYTSNHIDIQFTFNINVYGQLNLSGDGG